MAQILIMHTDDKKASEVKSQVEAINYQYKTRVVNSVEQLLSRTPNQSVNLVMLGCENMKVSDLWLLAELRKIGYECPLMVLANQIQREAWFKASALPGIFVVENQILKTEDLQLIEKIIANVEIMKRTHKRFSTEQRARLECYGKAGSFQGVLFNLSRSGAYVEYEQEGAPLNTGDYVRLDIELNELARHHRMHAKVVWTTPKGQYRGGYGLGVEFLKPDEVYKYLIGQM